MITLKSLLKTLPSIMDMLGHDTIDLLKIDIEGVECMVIDDMLKNEIYPKYLSVDFDTARCIDDGKDIVAKTMKKLLIHYDVYHNSNYDVTFIRK